MTFDADKLDELLLVERLLCAAMRSPVMMERIIRAGVGEAELEVKQHKIIWRAMVACWITYAAADAALVDAELRHAQYGLDDAKEWMRNVISSGGVADDETLSLYIERLRHLADLRRLTVLAGKLHGLATDGLPASQIISQVQAEMDSIAAGGARNRIRTSHELSERYVERLAKRDESPVERVPTGFPAVDKALRGGVRRGLVFTLGAPTGIGKTTFAQHIVLAASMYGPGAYWTFETSSELFHGGLVEMQAGVRESDNASRDGLSRLADAAAVVAARQIHIDDTESMTIEEWQARAFALVKSEGIKWAFVDYCQDIERSTRHGRDDLNYVHISKSFRRAVGPKRLNLALFLLSQVNEPEQDNRGRQVRRLATERDLSYTQQWGKDSSYVAILDRMKHDDNERVRNTTRLRLVKNRPDKELVTTWMYYDPSTTKLSQVDAKGEPSTLVEVPQPDDFDAAMAEADGDA